MRDLNVYSPLPRATSNPLLLPLQSLHPSIRPGSSFLFDINQFTGMGGEGGVRGMCTGWGTRIPCYHLELVYGLWGVRWCTRGPHPTPASSLDEYPRMTMTDHFV